MRLGKTLAIVACAGLLSGGIGSEAFKGGTFSVKPGPC
jgi:hypothetical protein